MTVKVLQGHVLDVLAGLPEKSVHVCVTSPPYWGLRAYGTPPQVWKNPDGTPLCEGEHDLTWDGRTVSESRTPEERAKSSTLGIAADGPGQRMKPDNKAFISAPTTATHEWGPAIVDKKRGQDAGDTARVGNTVKRVCPPETQQGAFCRKCGAWRGELGSEPTLDLFVRHLVEVFAAVGRVLRDDGTLWVNLGDSYAGGGQGNYGAGVSTAVHAGAMPTNVRNRPDWLAANGLKAGDLCMAPARFALAMQEAGWRLRSEITLCKTAPMPESVQGARWERCRVKVASMPSSRPSRQRDALDAGGGYETHGEGVQALPHAEWADCPGCPRCEKTDGLVQRWGSGRPTSATEKLYVFAKGIGPYFYDLEAVRVPNSPLTLAVHGTGTVQRTMTEHKRTAGLGHASGTLAENYQNRTLNGRNLWNWLPFTPEPLSAAHYAAYPRWLPRLAIQAGTSERGVCPGCGAPWLRVVERTPMVINRSDWGEKSGNLSATSGTMVPAPSSLTLGWRQSCACPPHHPVPATVLDPFSGSGTTVIEANALGRHGIGIELQSKYVDIAHQRLSGQPLSLFAHAGAEAFEAGAEAEALETTKQEQHPNRTVLGLPPLVEARDRPVGVEAEAAG